MMDKREFYIDGQWVKPAVANDFDVIDPATEEPCAVLSLIAFDDEEEAVKIANDTPYGLAAYINTGDQEKGRRIARQLRAGMVRLNGRGLSAGTPFGGYKQSGNGREGGVWGLEDFTEIKIVTGW